MQKARLIRKAAVVNSHKAGMTINQIATKYGLTQDTVRSYLREERISRAEERHELKEQRKAAVLSEHEAGTNPRDIAADQNISYQSVIDYIREGRMSDIALTYKETTCSAVSKYEIRKWSKDQVARQLHTPLGRMTVCEVYPHIMRFYQGRKYYTFTNGEIYYLNLRR